MTVYRVSETRIVSEWAEVEASSRDEAIAAYQRREWIGDIGEELDTEWDVEEVDGFVAWRDDETGVEMRDRV